MDTIKLVEGALLEEGLKMLTRGYSVIPVKRDKTPLGTWKPYQIRRMSPEELEEKLKKDGAEGLAIICGKISKGLEVIDIDLKYDLSGTLWEDLRNLIEDNLPGLSDRLVIAESRSRGIHVYYRTETPEGNLKLAYREATEEEAKGGDTKLILIETRGEGGYILTPPTPGYRFIQGDMDSIPTISDKQRVKLMSLCKSFNTLLEADRDPQPQPGMSVQGSSPWVAYNERGDVRGLLEETGWTFVESIGPRDYYLRPGKTDSRTSGNFHRDLRVFYVWSTSTQLEEGKGYNPSSLYMSLHGITDVNQVYQRLRSEGYGDPYTPKPKDPLGSVPAPTEDDWRDQYFRLNTEEEVYLEMEKSGDDIRTGYKFKLDGNEEEILLPSGGLTIVSARTSHRKTGLMLNLARNSVEFTPSARAIFLTIEETAPKLVLKFMNLCINLTLSPQVKSNYKYLKGYYKKELDPSPAIERERGPFYDKYINSGAVRFYYWERRIRELCDYLTEVRKRDPLVKVVFIDYIQLIRTDISYPTRQVAIFEICEDLRRVANNTGLALVLGAQFNRNVQGEEDLDPSNIREAGDIEQTANLVLGLWDRAKNKDEDKREDSLHVRVMKGRDIGTGWKEVLNYNPNSGRIFDNL